MASDRYVEHESPWLHAASSSNLTLQLKIDQSEPFTPYDSAYCHTAKSAVPEIPVTDEMIAAGFAADKAMPLVLPSESAYFPTIYRAMAAVAPEELYRPEERRIDALVAANQRWHDTWSATEMQRQQAVARVAELEAENAALRVQVPPHPWHLQVVSMMKYKELEAEFLAMKQASATFGDPTPADLPPPPRRPDGTLAPQPKPFPVLKQASASRRVGG